MHSVVKLNVNMICVIGLRILEKGRDGVSAVIDITIMATKIAIIIIKEIASGIKAGAWKSRKRKTEMSKSEHYHSVMNKSNVIKA